MIFLTEGEKKKVRNSPKLLLLDITRKKVGSWQKGSFKSQYKKINSTLWYGSINNTPNNCKVGFQKATGLEQFNFNCSHQKSSCPASVCFLMARKDKTRCFDGINLVIFGCKTRELHDWSFQSLAKETCNSKSIIKWLNHIIKIGKDLQEHQVQSLVNYFMELSATSSHFLNISRKVDSLIFFREKKLNNYLWAVIHHLKAETNKPEHIR